MGQKKKLGEGGTRTYATTMKRSSALNNFMIVAPLSYQAKIWGVWARWFRRR
jgi:hypothetical protein